MSAVIKKRQNDKIKKNWQNLMSLLWRTDPSRPGFLHHRLCYLPVQDLHLGRGSDDCGARQKGHSGATLVCGDPWHWDIDEDNLPWDTPTGYWLHPPLQLRNSDKDKKYQKYQDRIMINIKIYMDMMDTPNTKFLLSICLQRGTAMQFKTFWYSQYIQQI